MLHVESWGEFSWVAFGLLGQLLFTGRFLVQWIASERARRSYIPIAFWYFSIGGGVVLLAYALYRRDPVFVLGQATGIFIYARNLYLIHAERHEDEPAASEAEDGGPRVKNEV
ncbi:lipid A biosynthesis protein [Mesobaculum littorinae]|uniref:Lipid A biosynthesis protein n=2 Tax=Mesobaculum littorinae TaxID=2486419 RepID=A0A438AHV8_9RHOB|nr:lipid A biosynthesis protein [Mesobaculum littorinae]